MAAKEKLWVTPPVADIAYTGKATGGDQSISAADYRALTKAKKRSKYKNVKTIVDGITFHSKGEAERYQALLLLKKSGQISALLRQFRYPLIVNGVVVGVYIADFVYTPVPPPSPVPFVVEDYKGHRTPEYKLKKKLFEALYAPLTILETGRKTRRKKNRQGS